MMLGIQWALHFSIWKGNDSECKNSDSFPMNPWLAVSKKKHHATAQTNTRAPTRDQPKAATGPIRTDSHRRDAAYTEARISDMTRAPWLHRPLDQDLQKRSKEFEDFFRHLRLQKISEQTAQPKKNGRRL